MELWGYIKKFRENPSKVKAPNRKEYNRYIYVMKKNGEKKVSGSQEEIKSENVVKNDEPSSDESYEEITYTPLYRGTSSNPQNFKKAYNPKYHQDARARHYDDEFEYPTIFLGLNPEQIIQEIKAVPFVEGAIFRHYHLQYTIRQREQEKLEKKLDKKSDENSQLQYEISKLQEENSILLSQMKVKSDNNEKMNEPLSQMKINHSKECDKLKLAVMNLQDKQASIKAAFFYYENRAVSLTNGQTPTLPWLMVYKKQYLTTHFQFKQDLFYLPVKLAYTILSYLQLAIEDPYLKDYELEIAQDLLLAFKQIYTGRTRISVLFKYPDNGQNDRDFEMYKLYVQKLNVHPEVIEYVKRQIEESNDDELKKECRAILLYMEVLANNESSLLVPMPHGKGEIYRYHEEINEDEFIHPKLSQHIQPLDKEILDQLQERLVLKSEESLCYCGYLIENGEMTKAIKCNHVMHVPCFDGWVKEHKNCYRCYKLIEQVPYVEGIVFDE